MNKRSFYFGKMFCLLLLLGVFFALNVQANETKNYHFIHEFWAETVAVKDLKFCKKNGDCAIIENINKNTIKVKWDKYPPEIFVWDQSTDKWIYRQNVNIQQEYENAVYSFEEPFIKVNPYNKTPLSALVKFPTEKKSKISIQIKGKSGAPDIVHEFEGYRNEHEIPILGLYSNFENKVILKAVDKKGNKNISEITIPIEDISLSHQWITTLKKDKNFHYYATYTGHVYDDIGYLRYFFHMEGWHLTYFYKDSVYVETTHGGVTKYSLLGKFLKHYSYPAGFYSFTHGMGFKDNGNILVIGSFEGSKALVGGSVDETHRDFVLEIDNKTGQVLAQYDLAEMLNPDRSLIVKSAEKDYGKVDWAHTNGIDYDAKNKAVIVSGRHLGIVKIDEKTKKPIWWITPHQLTHKSGRNGDKGDISHLLLTAVDKNGNPYPKEVQKGTKKAEGFKWPLKTHSIKYVGKGFYSIFDNSGKMYDKNLYTTENSYASVYKIDEKKKTIRQIFLKDLGVYSEVASSVIAYPKMKEYLVFSAHNASLNSKKIRNGEIYRFNEKGDLIYKAICHRGDGGWDYLIHPYEFYSNNNWPTAQE